MIYGFEFAKFVRFPLNNTKPFFIDNFVTPLSADAVDNYSGLNLAVANTFRNLSALQKIDLQSGFEKLFA